MLRARRTPVEVTSVAPATPARRSRRRVWTVAVRSAPSSTSSVGRPARTPSTCRWKVSRSAPWTANTAAPSSWWMAAATSSLVERGLEAHRASSAPPATRARQRLAVSVVTCRQAAMRWPARGGVRASSSATAASTGMRLAAKSILRRPSGARSGSLSSVSRAGTPPWSGGQAEQTPGLGGLEVEGGRVGGPDQPGHPPGVPRTPLPADEAGQPAQRPGRLGVLQHPQAEGQGGRGRPVAGLELERRGRGPQIALAVVPVAGGGAGRGDQPELLGVPQHPGAGPDPPGGVPNAHGANATDPYIYLSRLARVASAAWRHPPTSSSSVPGRPGWAPPTGRPGPGTGWWCWSGRPAPGGPRPASSWTGSGSTTAATGCT